MDRIVTANFKTALTALTIALLVVSLAVPPALAETPDSKTVDTLVYSFENDGTTVYCVSHITGIMQWIIEPTGYVDDLWSGHLIPVDGVMRVISSTLQHDTSYWDDSRGGHYILYRQLCGGG